LIFQKISPPDSLWTFFDVQSAALGLSAAAAAPSPLVPDAVAGDAVRLRHLLALATVLASAGSGFFLAFSGGTAVPQQ